MIKYLLAGKDWVQVTAHYCPFDSRGRKSNVEPTSYKTG